MKSVPAFAQNPPVRLVPATGNRQRQPLNDDSTETKQRPKRARRNSSIDVESYCAAQVTVPETSPAIAVQKESIVVADSSDNIPGSVDEFPDDIMAAICDNGSSLHKDETIQSSANINDVSTIAGETGGISTAADTESVCFDPNLDSKGAIVAIE
ncbi:hypothetical protein GGI23_006085, partial [Coemansia sp. RSA 2559]